MDMRNTKGMARFNVVELPIDAEKKEGIKLQQAMSDLLNYWLICMDGKDVPNSLRYSMCEEITNRLSFALAILSRSVERYNYNFKMNQPENKDKYRVPYKPFDILQDSRKAEDEFAICAYMIKGLYERPQFKRRKSELERLTGICKKMMRGVAHLPYYPRREMNTGVVCACARGGNWNNGSNAGLSYANCNNSLSNTNNNYGARSASKRNKEQLPTERVRVYIID